MPWNFYKLNTLSAWGSVITCSFLPLLKNILANKLIEHTGLTPYKVVEVCTILSVVLVGFFYSAGKFSIVALVSILLMCFGRILGLIDSLLHEAELKDDYVP